MADTNEFIVKSATSDRLYVKVYHDFLDSELFDRNEKMVFILLKRYLDFRDDYNGVSGEVHPTLETLAKQCQMSIGAVRRTLKKLQDKNVLKIKRQGLNMPNVYILMDFAEVWGVKTQEESKEEVTLFTDVQILEKIKNDPSFRELAKRNGINITLLKEKEPVSEYESETSSIKNQINQSNILYNNYNTNEETCQEADYSMDKIREHFDYAYLINTSHISNKDVEVVFQILYDTLNTQKPTIRVAGEDKPTDIVKSRLLKLTYGDIEHSIDKFHKKTGHIKDVNAYLLTILYGAKERSYLEMMNLGHTNGDF